jgi:ABC-type glycerol-3-phosphate transport system substrate-binding protein
MRRWSVILLSLLFVAAAAGGLFAEGKTESVVTLKMMASSRSWPGSRS